MENQDILFDQQLTELLEEAFQYEYLIRHGYQDSIDLNGYTEYFRKVVSLEAGNAPNINPENAADIGESGKDYGKANRYTTNGAPSEGAVRDFKQWVKMEAGEIATNGIVTFVESTDKLLNVIGSFIRKQKLKYQLNHLPNLESEVFPQLDRWCELRKEKNDTAVTVTDIKLCIERLQGYSNIVDVIQRIAEESDEDAFDSDRTWDQFAAQSNKALKARRPKNGMFFRELERTTPYEHKVSCLQSDWMQKGARKELVRTINKTKDEVMKKVEDVLTFLKKLMKGLESEVSHRKLNHGDAGGATADNIIGDRKGGRSGNGGEEVVVKYARGYVATKFIIQLQDMFVQELKFIIVEMPKRFKYRDPNKELGPVRKIKDTFEKAAAMAKTPFTKSENTDQSGSTKKKSTDDETAS